MSAGKDLPVLSGPGTLKVLVQRHTTANWGKEKDIRDMTQMCSMDIENALNSVSICTTA